MSINILTIVANLMPFYLPQRDLSDGIKIVTIDKILAFVMHQKILCNGVVIVRPADYACTITIGICSSVVMK
jgi:hypothetical protein